MSDSFIGQLLLVPYNFAPQGWAMCDGQLLPIAQNTALFSLLGTMYRMIESIQQFDIIYAMTQGGPGDRLTVFQVEAYLNFFQSTNVGRSAALMMILWAITYFLSNMFIKNWLRLRERTRGDL